MWSQKDKAESNIIRMFYSDGIRFGSVLLKKAGEDANCKAEYNFLRSLLGSGLKLIFDRYAQIFYPVEVFIEFFGRYISIKNCRGQLCVTHKIFWIRLEIILEIFNMN